MEWIGLKAMTQGAIRLQIAFVVLDLIFHLTARSRVAGTPPGCEPALGR
jgi:hypothetical protein